MLDRVLIWSLCNVLAVCYVVSRYDEPRQESVTVTNSIVFMLSQFGPPYPHFLGFSCCTICIISSIVFLHRLSSLGTIFIILGSWFLYYKVTLRSIMSSRDLFYMITPELPPFTCSKGNDSKDSNYTV